MGVKGVVLAIKFPLRYDRRDWKAYWRRRLN
jgi:hypothetical protein